MNQKKAQGLPINAIILAVLALIVLVVLVVIFSGRTQKVGDGANTQTFMSEINSIQISGEEISTADKFNNAASMLGLNVRAKTISSPFLNPDCKNQGGIVASELSINSLAEYCICNGPCN
jgi:hypothetical protein